MGTRRKARELAMQALFYMDMRGRFSAQALDLFCRSQPVGTRQEQFFMELVQGVTANRADVDAGIERYSSHWKLHRMACVDRNVLRIAVYEMMYCPEIPAKVSINEGIDIAKKFGTEESGSFVNGILDSIHVAMGQGALAIGTKKQAPMTPELPDQAPVRDPRRSPDLVPVRGRSGVVKRRSTPS